MPIHVTTSTTQSLSNKTFVDRVSTTGVVYADSGNSNQWSSTYSSVYATSAKYESTYTTVSAISSNLMLGQLGISIDGAGSVIATGVKQYLRVPYNCTITSYELVAKPSGSIVIDVYKSTYENYPPTTSIVGGGGTPPTIDSNVKYRDTTLASWSKTLTAGEYLGFNVTSVTSITAVTLTLTTLK
jgi:hypothetical protein